MYQSSLRTRTFAWGGVWSPRARVVSTEWGEQRAGWYWSYVWYCHWSHTQFPLGTGAHNDVEVIMHSCKLGINMAQPSNLLYVVAGDRDKTFLMSLNLIDSASIPVWRQLECRCVAQTLPPCTKGVVFDNRIRIVWWWWGWWGFTCTSGGLGRSLWWGGARAMSFYMMYM